MLNAIQNAPTADSAAKMVQDFYKKTVNPVVAPVVDKIANTEAGFKAFCEKNNYKFDGWGGGSGRTKEKNSLGTYEWYWDMSSNTFQPF